MEDSTLPQSGPDSRQLPLLSETNTASESSPSIGRACRSMTTLENSGGAIDKRLSLHRADFLASHLAQAAKEWPEKITATSGRNISGLSANLGHVGLLAKMLLESSIWHSTECLPTWTTSATPRGRLIYRLLPAGLPTNGVEFSLLPTPQASDNRNRGSVGRSPSMKKRLANGKQVMLSMLFDGAPCPQCVERIMGFPTGWSVLPRSEILALRAKPTRSSKQSRKSRG